jgi:putrescine transport system permease protein
MRRGAFLTAALIAGFVFLYVPIGLLVLTSFNSSRLTTVWTGLSLRWFVTLAQDETLIGAALLSLRVAALAATGATVLGALAGYALARLVRFPGRFAFAGLLAAPLVLPDLLIALGLLLLIVFVERALGFPQRGAMTIVVAHVTASLAYVAIVVEARLAGSGTVLEEAAMDLGATPIEAFLRVTVPLLAPALLSGWLLAFTLSLDDVVIASFVSGPGASTLPMVVFSMLHLGATPELNALATVILGIVAAALLVALLSAQTRAPRTNV